MKTFEVLEITTVVDVYHVKAISEQAAIDKIETAFADTNHPDIMLVPEGSDITDRVYQCEGEIKNERIRNDERFN